MKSYICFVFCVLFCSCANIVPPSGGDRDFMPPKLLSAFPNNKSVNFNSQKIILEFDEHIQIRNVENITISPLCSSPLKIVTGVKKIEIIIGCTLDPKTTYTINFGKSIIDLNEGNVLENFKYVFSPGKTLDSLVLHGWTEELYFNKKAENILVGLYKNTDSLRLYYYTFSDSNGNFLIENIKNDKYVLFAIGDKNNNFQYDYGEIVSMPETIIDFNPVKNLGLFYEIPDWPIISVRNPNKNLIKFEHTILEDSILILNSSGFWSRNSQSSEFWFKDSPAFLVYQFNSLIDSIKIHNSDSVNLELKLVNNLNTMIKKGLITIKSNTPVDTILPDKFIWTSSNDSLKPYLIDFFTIAVPINFKFGNQANLILRDGAIRTKNDSENDSILFNFDCNPNNYGTLSVKSVSNKKNLVIELFNKNVISHKSQLSDSFIIKWILPGNYNIRVFDDKNQNNNWDPGNIDSQIEAEPIYGYPETLKIRSNWETEILIDF